MIKRSVSVYFRIGRIYIHPMAYTDMGILIAVEPFKEITYNALGAEILKLLETDFGRVPHPTTWNQLQQLIEIAGAKNYKDFARKCTYITVDLCGEIISIKRWEWDGKGFSPMNNAIELPSTCSSIELEQYLT